MNPADLAEEITDLPPSSPPNKSELKTPTTPSSPLSAVICHPNVVDLAVELKDNAKLSGTNYLEWKIKISAILQLKLVNGTETPEEAEKRDKADPDQYKDALAILVLNCDSKISACFLHESKEDPKAFWKLLDEYYQPKTVQNQATYLNRIFSTLITSNNLENTLNSISDNCRLLCSIIDDKTTTPSELLDSVIAMWVLFNLPPEFTSTGELLLKKCQIDKKTLSLKTLVEDVRNYLQRNNESQEANKALAAYKRQQHQQQKKPYNGPKCSPGYHNPKTVHPESECSFLQNSGPKTEKPTKALHTSHNGQFSESVLDSGATTSMFNDLSFFPSLSKSTETIYLADGSQTNAKGVGTARVEFPHAIVTLKNSLYVPSLTSNLISLSTFIKNGYMLSSHGGSLFKLCDKTNTIVLTGSLVYGNFIVTSETQKAYHVDLKSDICRINIKHQAAGHPSLEYFYKMYPDLPRKDFSCTTCDVSKRHKEPFLSHFCAATQKLDYIQIDLCGPITPPSESGFKYFLRAVDGFSHYVWVQFLTYKSEVKDILKELFSFIKNESKEKICHLVTDNGTKFKNQTLQTYYASKGIAHLTTAPYHPENNPFAERGNRTTVEKAQCILKDSGLGLSFWAEAVNCAVHLENLSPCKSINFSSPSEMWFGKQPSLAYLHPFGCQAIYLLNRSAGKVWSRGAVGIFLGYGEGHRSFRVLDEETGNVHITHHVKFNDHVFPALNKSELPNRDEEIDLLFTFSSDSPSPDTLTPTPPSPIPSNQNNSDHDIPLDEENRFEEVEDQDPNLNQSQSNDDIIEMLNPGRQQRNPISNREESKPMLDESHPSSKYYAWVPEDEPASQEIRGDVDPSNIIKSGRRTCHSANTAILSHDDPRTYHQAVSAYDSGNWESAISNELGNIVRLNVWSVVDVSGKDIRPLTTTWVFKKKTDQDGNLTKYKAFHQMDVQCAFLNGTPEEDLYIHAPLGLDAAPKTVLKLHKALYGLNQSPQCWQKALTAALRSIGLKPTYSDPCLYVSADESKPFFLFVHVDDLLFGGSWPDLFKENISAIFDMEDLGIAKYTLGIQINQFGGSIALVQDKYINTMLDEFHISNNRTTLIPLPSNWKQLKHDPSEKPKTPPFNYRRVVGLIQWLVQCTRLDLAFALSFLSQFLEDPRECHYKAAQHTLRYISTTKDQHLILGQNDLKQESNELIGFSDSDWNGSKSWNSYSASIIYFHGTVGWRSHKQQTVALSSAEGEYVSLSDSSQDLLWCMNVLEELHILPKLTLCTDNQSAIAIASNPIYHHGTQHINFRYHFIRDHVESKLITLKYLQTDKMQANLLTKNLTEGKTTVHHTKLMGEQCKLSKE
ncbi:hypothetical protein PCASD_19810 [Puccinia coronata f. sp. avenae]|uniref:Integrase catalytic domain-containing protein n=1 Tax=Puccinia coronata f. sp. avenae TaxID=200324 RepID=A0A2N5SXS1_9BASI|nr:hypothetical protein PCASD_19810 [Puccinia coronata f. sp. avenae]